MEKIYYAVVFIITVFLIGCVSAVLGYERQAHIRRKKNGPKKKT